MLQSLMGLDDLKEFLKRNEAVRSKLKKKADTYMKDMISGAYKRVNDTPMGDLPITTAKLELIDNYAQKIRDAISIANKTQLKSIDRRLAVIRRQPEPVDVAKISARMDRAQNMSLSAKEFKDLKVIKSKSDTRLVSRPALPENMLHQHRSGHVSGGTPTKVTKTNALAAAYLGKKDWCGFSERNSSSPIKIRASARGELKALSLTKTKRKPALIEIRRSDSTVKLRSN